MSDTRTAGPVLEITTLSVELPKGTDRRYAVDDVSITISPHEIVCLVGESGSGKSVTAHSVMGLLPKGQLTPVEGSIRLHGEDLLTASDDRLRALRGARMSMIFQEPMTALNPTMTCGDQIEEVLTTHTDFDTDERRRRILAILEQVHLPDPPRMAASYPHQLSGGQRQRIMIAMALVLEPSLLIADEPTTALDVTTQAQILKLISEIQQTHDTGVLFITHDFGVVAEIADRVAVMQWGKIVEQGDAKTVLQNPQHAYTRMLIAAVPSFTPIDRPRHPDAAVVLKTHGLSKTYSGGTFMRRAAGVRAADDVTLEVRKGETLGIVGESGSGKSTVARCIARLIDPSSGAVLLDGTVGRHRKRPPLGLHADDAILQGHPMALHHPARVTDGQLDLRAVPHPRRQLLRDHVVHGALVQVTQTLMPANLRLHRLVCASHSKGRLLAPSGTAPQRHEPRALRSLLQREDHATGVAQTRCILQESEALLPQPRPGDEVRREVSAAHALQLRLEYTLKCISVGTPFDPHLA